MQVIQMNIDQMVIKGQKLNDYFIKMEKKLDQIVEAYDKLKDISIWDAPSAEYFLKMRKAFNDNVITYKNKVNNINTYLEDVINNFEVIESSTFEG